VAVSGEGLSPNAYSATPEQVRRWLESAQKAFTMCGPQDMRYAPGEQELSSLRGLRRGVYVRRTISKGSRLQPENIFRAIPAQDGQLTANEMSKYTEFYALQDIVENRPVLIAQLRITNNRERIYEIIQAVRQVLTDSKLSLPSQVDMEISHHYGIDRFYECGITMLEIVNREYCKKLLVMLPNQLHPEQYHQIKEETFHILHGEVSISLNGKEQLCRAGDVITAERGVRHSMRSLTGVVIEEISTKHFIEDSYYTDPAIMANPERKTLVTHWMR
jgi:mannose-6-phosphate isomerase-like protein (cupin superfamily)